MDFAGDEACSSTHLHPALIGIAPVYASALGARAEYASTGPAKSRWDFEQNAGNELQDKISV
jgi:hypothetical protein